MEYYIQNDIKCISENKNLAKTFVFLRWPCQWGADSTLLGEIYLYRLHNVYYL